MAHALYRSKVGAPNPDGPPRTPKNLICSKALNLPDPQFAVETFEAPLWLHKSKHGSNRINES